MELNFEQLKKWFLPYIQKVVQNEIKKEKQFTVYKGVVSSVSTDYANIVLQGDSITLSSVINKTGEILSIGDRVWIWAINNDMGNAIIAFRMENDIT